MAVITAAGSTEGIRVMSAAFVENGAGTYDADFQIPIGATILDVQIDGVALWTAATSASLEIGDAADPDGFWTAIDLKATDLLAGEGLSFAKTGSTEAGAYWQVVASHNAKNLMDTTQARVLRARIVSVGAGTAGRTTVRVIYTLAAPVTVTQ